MIACHFCGRELPEPLHSHVVYAEGRLHRADPMLPLYPVCVACRRFHKLIPRKLVSRATIERGEAQ